MNMEGALPHLPPLRRPVLNLKNTGSRSKQSQTLVHILAHDRELEVETTTSSEARISINRKVWKKSVGINSKTDCDAQHLVKCARATTSSLQQNKGVENFNGL